VSDLAFVLFLLIVIWMVDQIVNSGGGGVRRCRAPLC